MERNTKKRAFFGSKSVFSLDMNGSFTGIFMRITELHTWYLCITDGDGGDWRTSYGDSDLGGHRGRANDYREMRDKNSPPEGTSLSERVPPKLSG